MEGRNPHLGVNKSKLLQAERLRIREVRTNLAGFLHGAARHLGRVLDKKIVQYIHLPAFLSAYWTSNCTHWSERPDLLLEVSAQDYMTLLFQTQSCEILSYDSVINDIRLDLIFDFHMN